MSNLFSVETEHSHTPKTIRSVQRDKPLRTEQVLETEQTKKTPRQYLDVAFAIDYELWEEVTKRMHKKQLTLSETVTNALKQYLKIK